MASNTRGRASQENADQDEDEFNDFGGFEAAEPAADISALQAQAGASPWAIFNAGNAPGRPDLLCAQNRFPTYLDPSDISGTSAEPAGTGLIYPAVNGAVQPQADLFGAQFVENQDLLSQAQIAENVLDGALSAATVSGHAVANGRLPDIGLGINEDRIFGQVDEAGGPTAIAGNNRPELSQEEGLLVNWDNIEVEDVAARREEVTLEQQANVQLAAVESNAEEQASSVAVSQASRVTEAALQERLNSMTESNHALEEELQRVREDLTAQRSRLHDIHARHTEELEDVRKAGHDALAVVVGQYKEQSRVVVIEQQELAQRHLVETLADQMRAFKDMLQMQQELHEQRREEDRQELCRRIDIAVEESRHQQQEQFDAFLVKEQATQREVLEKAMETERAASQERFQRSLQEEQQKMQAKFEELEAACSLKLDDQRRTQEIALKAAVEEEQRLAQEQMAVMVSEERERGREAVRSALEASMVDVRAYIDEQRQADSRVRRRHLASLDVFLESSRQQIALLLDSEKPALKTNPPPSSAHPPPSPHPPPSAHQHNNGSGES